MVIGLVYIAQARSWGGRKEEAVGERDWDALVGRRLGGYELLRLLGAGGMAEVYLARDLTLDRDVAVKVLPPVLAADAGYVRHFRDEARRVANLNHPHIIPIYHADEQDGLLFMVMPVYPESLRDRIERAGRPTPERAVNLTIQIADALAAAHQVGIIHRDVKPENILIDGEWHAVLTDFGVAREMRGPLWDGQRITPTSSGHPVGTPEYMAPEQFMGGTVGPQADVFALGTVLYELLVGRVPREAETPEGVIRLTLTRRPVVPPMEFNSAVWPALNRAVMTAMEHQPHDRFAEMALFSSALRQSLQYRDEPARPISTHETLRLRTAPPALPATMAAGTSSGTEEDVTTQTTQAIQPVQTTQTTPTMGPPRQAPPSAPAMVRLGDGRPVPVLASALASAPALWTVSYHHRRKRRGWRPSWRVGAVALLLLGIAGVSLGGMLALHAQRNGRGAQVDARGAGGPGGKGLPTVDGTGSGKGVNAPPLTTQEAATATIVAATATVIEATSTAEGTPAATNTPIPLTPVLTYNPPNTSTGGPGNLSMGPVSGKPASCSTSLAIYNSDAQSRTWAITSWQNAKGITAIWSYSVTNASGATTRFPPTALPSGSIEPNSSETLTASFTQAPGAPCGGAVTTLAAASIEDNALATSYGFTIASN